MAVQTCTNQQSQMEQRDFSRNSRKKSSKTLGISQEMTMMHQKLEQTSLSGSSFRDTEIEQQSSEQLDDPDFIMSGKRKVQKIAVSTCSSDESPLTYQDYLQSQTSSVWDLLSGDSLGGVDPSQVLCKPKRRKPNPRPWIAFNDLNNSDDASWENKPKPAIEIGIAFDF